MPERMHRAGASLKPWDPVLGRESGHPPMDMRPFICSNVSLTFLSQMAGTPCVLSVSYRELRLVRCRDAKVGAKRRPGSVPDSVPTRLGLWPLEVNGVRHCQRHAVLYQIKKDNVTARSLSYVTVIQYSSILSSPERRVFPFL